jgi:hypothetical protein
MVSSIEHCLGKEILYTTEKYYLFIGINQYIQIIFIGLEINKYKVIFVGLGQSPMNIWDISLTLTDFIYSSVEPRYWWIYVSYIRRWCDTTDEYMGRRVAVMGKPMNIGDGYRRDHFPYMLTAAAMHLNFSLHALACHHRSLAHLRRTTCPSPPCRTLTAAPPLAHLPPQRRSRPSLSPR